MMTLVLIWGITFAEEAREEYCFNKYRDDTVAYYEQLGVLDPRDSRFFFRSARSFFADCRDMESRLAKWEDDIPPYSDLYLLPEYKICHEYWLEAGRYKTYLYKKLPLAHPVELEALLDNIRDIEFRHDFWYKAYLCRCEYNYSADGIRVQLQELRAFVGRKAYDNVYWPDHLPPIAYDLVWK